jgi:hypothetical protein
MYLVPKDGGPEGLQRGPVVEQEVDVIAEEGAEADAEHRGYKEEEKNVELALTCNIQEKIRRASLRRGAKRKKNEACLQS